MSTTSPDERITTYTPVVPTTEFPALFPIFANDDLSVYVDGVERVDFTVTASYVDGVSNNAKVIMNTGVTGSVIIAGERDPRRQNRFGFGPIPPRDLNLAFDTVEGEMQEARRDIERSVRSEIGEPGYILSTDLADGDVPMKQGLQFVPGPNLPDLASSLIADATAQANRAQEEADRSDREADRADAEADRAAGYLNDAVSEKEVPITGTRNGMEALQFPAGMNSLETRGYAVMGDGGGAQYVRVASEPAHGLKVRSVDRFLPNGSTDAANGGWWEIAEREINVRMAGAGAGGDDTSLFERAAKAAKARVNIVSQAYAGVPRADVCLVGVPPGDYTLSQLLDVGNRHVHWVVDNAAIVVGINYINGKVIRPENRTTNSEPHGTADYAVGWSVVAGGDIVDRSAGVTGVADTGQLASYPNRDKVALFVSARPNPALVDVSSATYTSSTVTSNPLSTSQMKKLRRGMIIDTKHATRWSGFLDSWNSDGSVLTVLEWRPAGGTMNSPLPAGTPPDGTGFLLNAFTKLWAQNSTAHLTPEGTEDALIGHEYSLYNTRRDFNDRNLEAAGNSFWGELMSLAGGGSYKMGAAGYVVAGPWKYGYAVRGLTGVEAGFHYQTTLSTGDGFTYKGGSRAFVGMNLTWDETFTVSSVGNIQIGASAASSTKLVDFRTSGNGNSYDYRIEVSGGGAAGSPGGATVRHLAVNNAFGGNVYPTADNVRSLGTASARWTQVYAATATINTSDERDKQDIEAIPDAWLDAWGEVEWRRFRWKDAVEAKGDEARWHLGLMAQQIERVFAAHNIDAFAIGLLCLDPLTEIVIEEIEEEQPVFEDVQIEAPEDHFDGASVVRKLVARTIREPKTISAPVVDQNGEPVLESHVVGEDEEGNAITALVPLIAKVPVMEKVLVQRTVERETGEFRYGLRYTEAFAIEAAWMRRELSSR